MLSFTSSFKTFNVVIPHPRIFFTCIPTSAGNFKPNSIKTLLANGLSAFFVKGEPIFCNGKKSLPRNPPDCIILDS